MKLGEQPKPGEGFDKPEFLVKRAPQQVSAGFHGFIPPAEAPSIFSAKFIKSTIIGMNDLLEGKGYPPGAVISLVSVPKAGKTTMALYEALRMALRGDDVLYMYNESIKQERSEEHTSELQS